MELKYKLLAESIEFQGATLYRITALKDFGDVKAGDKGGYIQLDANLSHDGNCWVYDEAKVCGDAKVSHNAKVAGRAEVFGNARVYYYALISGNVQVYDKALVSGKAKVCDEAKVYGDALISDNAKVYELAHVSGSAKVFGNAWVYGDAVVTADDVINEHMQVYSKRRHAEEREDRMSKLKKAEALWDEYCKSTDIKVTDGVEIQLNPCEPRLKVGIFKGDKGIHFTLEEIKALAEALDSI